MSRAEPTEFETLTLAIACTLCGVEAGVWCRTAGNAQAAWLHARRERPILAAWRAGRQAAIRGVEQDPRTVGPGACHDVRRG